VILSQLANARANITILADLAGLAKSRFFSKSRDFLKFDFSIFLMFMIDQNTREG